MFKKEEMNEKIGTYLKELILSKYESVRKFCIDYIKISGSDGEDFSEIAKMQNRMTQIIKGNKAIQIYDLPIFCELLNVSCEEILSAGKSVVPISGHITNYEIAFSKDEAMWDKYIHRDDKLILNSDEYNKTVIDYALEFKNYKFLKYLMDNEYIWFVDEEYDSVERGIGFGAGTSIKRRGIGFQDTLGTTLQCKSEECGLRQKMIALAMENEDFEMLVSLRAREIPTLYQICCYSNSQKKCNEYYDKSVIEEIAKSSEKVLEYFSETFAIKNQFGHEGWFIYPYMTELLKYLIADKNKYAEAVLKRTIEHNKKIYTRLSEMIKEAFDISKRYFNYGDNYKIPVEQIIKDAMKYYQFYVDDGLVWYMFVRGKKDYPKFFANVICVEAVSDDLSVNALVKELNKSYEAVRNIQSNVSEY